MTNGTPRPDDDVLLRLGSDEALVLFELLARWMTQRDAPAPGAETFESSAECAVLDVVLAKLESVLVEPFDADYVRLVDEARERVASRWGGATLRD